MTAERSYIAVDLGAGSGRTFLGTVGAERVRLDEVHRFHYDPRRLAGHLRWDMPRLFAGLGEGLRRAHQAAGPRTPCSVGVDTWGVDYGLVDADGWLLEEPCTYRDVRTDGVMEEILARVPREDIFATTGVQFLQFNTAYQLVAHVREGLPAGAVRLLMMPDLCHHWLCGSVQGEETNASTTQLCDARTRIWAEPLIAALGLPIGLLPDLVSPGTELGRLLPARQAALGLGPLTVVAPATHDTASAVAGTPLQDGWAYVSSGTWSLVGVERTAPLVDARAAAANVTNEAGAFGTVRLLKNVMGLWILESCRQEWDAQGGGPDLAALLAGAAALRACPGFIAPDDPRFFHPAGMTAQIRASLAETRQPAPEDPVSLTRIVLDSLAYRYASVVDTLERLTGRPIPGLHIVGGGSRNDYLNQAAANACGRPVVAGPVEATAAGNVLVQAVATGALPSLAEGRRRLAASIALRRFEPRDEPAWRDARRRYRDVTGEG